MKPEVVPTAPQERLKRPPGRGWSPVMTISLSLLAGVIGGALAQSYLFNLTMDSGGAIVFLPNTPMPGTASSLATLAKTQAPALVTILAADTDQVLGRGVVISDDGWLATTQSVMGEMTAVTVVLANGTIVKSSLVLNDFYSDITYVKISSQDLTVVDFKAQPALLGETVVVYSRSLASGDLVTVTTIANIHDNDSATFSTQHYPLAYRLDQTVSLDYVGAAVFDLQGALVGLVSNQQQVIPVEALQTGIYSVFSAATIQRHQLELVYEPLYRERNFSSSGVQIVSSNQVNLVPGDVVTAVNDSAITVAHDLSVVLAELDLGDVVEFTVERGGEDTTVEVVLD